MSAIKGGEFLIRQTKPEEIFIPEEWGEEEKMIAQTCRDFLEQEIIPRVDELDSMKDPNLMPSLLKKAGELGILSISIPTEYGGMGMDFKTSMLAAEAVGGGHSFSVAISAHTGIGTLPILYYGSEEQKQEYIPKLASGEWLGCYCLTEPSAGSDANSGKTKAVLEGDKWNINGQKMWITNGGFADVYTVFAKIDDDKNLSAFIVEKGAEGLSLNPEEKKMGIKGSSTRQVFFNDVKVDQNKQLSDRENGFKIALNILNVGRIKLAAATLGASKDVVTNSIHYANERNQFGRPISKYGAIKYKIGEMGIRTYALESAVYRISQNIQDRIKSLEAEGMEKGKATLKGIEEYAAECAMMKVVGSEVLDYVTDEGVQIHGGMGYSAETSVEKAYRDSRINRIFEGTNEINRMLTVDMILKKAMKGELDLMGAAKSVQDELLGIPDFGDDDDSLFAKEYKLIDGFKKSILMVAGAAAQKLMMELSKEQEILMNIADMANDAYVAESIVLRVNKRINMMGDEGQEVYKNMARVFVHDAADRINKNAKDALMSFAEGDELRMMLMGIKRFTKSEPFNVKDARRDVANHLINANKYSF
ncbi:MAG: acyl-CoA dehydrogenase family protein [Salibacteraceae bacterium]|jgi:alkylation response protein AidB-like acyl-CoA dehydrogenase|nr:acyl-CoA dehydrogenase family protein [Salibacteraceae bacterium]MDP4687700.1 acyl-CoA dehydrogenase family protein [Salibacteraceae bacterium]MDP4762504.1 acyl-CoA dehydrogenase family protein [Salibacteraceae bacterium]MDP4844015.1 acyl-CoA dehydrogenase family protein [Salibacteraceae bacterium]MDP4933432.1 acyl-CoA dehydrogenase family protein [Salibacteraceae bacterium]